MKFTAISYTFFAALIGFACGSLHSCIERDKRKAVEPAEVVIPAAEEPLVDQNGQEWRL